MSPLPLGLVASARKPGGVTDSFDRADGSLGTSDSGHTWTVPRGSWSISSNQAVPGTSSAENWALINFGQNNVLVTAKIPVTPATPSSSTSLVARASSDGTTAYVCAVNAASVQLFKLVSGSWTQLGSNYTDTWQATKVYGLRVNGTSISVEIDGSAVISQTDSSISSNSYVGIRRWTTGSAIDNFAAEALP